MFLVLAISNQGNKGFVMNSTQVLSLQYVSNKVFVSISNPHEGEKQLLSLPQLKTLYPLGRKLLNAF
jgi:hypothetical protein